MEPSMHTPVPGSMSIDEYAMELRLQKLEEVTVQFAAHTAAEEFRFEMISNQIADLSKKLDETVGGIKTLLEDLKARQDEHHQFLQKLKEDESKAKERKKSVIKGLVWVIAASMGAFLAKFGETIYDFFFGGKP